MVTSDASHDTPVGLKAEISGWEAIAPLYDAARLQNHAKELRASRCCNGMNRQFI